MMTKLVVTPEKDDAVDGKISNGTTSTTNNPVTSTAAANDTNLVSRGTNHTQPRTLTGPMITADESHHDEDDDDDDEDDDGNNNSYHHCALYFDRSIKPKKKKGRLINLGFRSNTNNNNQQSQQDSEEDSLVGSDSASSHEDDEKGSKLYDLEDNGNRQEIRRKINCSRRSIGSNRKTLLDVSRFASPTNSDDVIESDHYCFTPEDTNSSCDNLRFSPMMIPASPAALDVPMSKTMISIRDAVSHLTRLDDFDAERLANGFFSEVYKVTHRATGKVMVLKMNKVHDNRSNSLKENELLNRLNHPNIVAYMGTVVHEGSLHPLLEYINGGTLEQLMRPYYLPEIIARFRDEWEKNGELKPIQHRLRCPDTVFMFLMQDVCRGMAYLHGQGYLHRDLAAKNIFIRKNDTPKRRPMLPTDTDIDDSDDYRLEAVIGDFGFATPEPSSPEKRISTVGSPYWLAPECINYKWYNHKCDIFSFGVICCELNWHTLADPDFLPRCDNFKIDFDKLPVAGHNTPLGRIAMMACELNPNSRPEFYELLAVLDAEIGEVQSFLPSGLVAGQDLRPQSPDVDIFELHLRRRQFVVMLHQGKSAVCENVQSSPPVADHKR